MRWMVVNELKRNPDKVEIMLVGSYLLLGNGSMLMLAGIALSSKSSVCSVGVLLHPGLLLDIQVAAVMRGVYPVVTQHR